LLRMQDPAVIQEVIPKHKLINYQGHNLAVPHTLEVTKVLRNMGVNAPSPIMYYYSWPGRFKALAHQKDTAQFLTLNRRGWVLNETGTMKTASALWAADYLMSLGLIHKVLVVSTLSSLEHTWLREVFNVLMHRSAVVLYGTREQRRDRLATDADIYIINHDGVGVIYDELQARNDIDLIILDEASFYRSGTTEKYKLLRGLLQPRNGAARRFWPMTATPCPNAPTDAFAVSKLVSPARVPEYFNQFKRATMLQITQYKWVPKAEAYELAFNAMQPAIRYRKEDCLDLPPMVVEERSCEMSKEQKVAYELMRKHLIMEAKAGTTITAVNAADKISKLRQILLGAVRDADTGEYSVLPHKPRFDLLLECIGLAAAKVIVIVPFKGIITPLAEELKSHYTCDVMNGDVTPKRRNEIVQAFKTQKDPHVLLCHPKVIAHSLTLTEADMIIFYGPIYSNDEAMQVVERINRPGQTKKMTVIRMACSALEWGIYAMLDSKQAGQSSILDLYNQVIS